ncbi:MAG: hypothetical protein JNL67_14500 [Planctomycetaceae bacterium]|nr:hypothetical protein [Planctomycetaceae bacterium]
MDQQPADDVSSSEKSQLPVVRDEADRDSELGRVLQTIQQLQSLNFPTDDTTERMLQVDVVQDELIKQLDELNQLVQHEIDRLTQNRSVVPLPATATEAL